VASFAVEGDTLTARIVSRNAAGDDLFNSRCAYRLRGSGEIDLEWDLTPLLEIASLPRVGLQLRAPSAFNELHWYGRGPHETYPDRKQSGRVGVWCENVDAANLPYVMPQEFGNKTDVRWAALTGAGGRGIRVESGERMQVSAHPFETATLEEARHVFSLHRGETTVFNIDFEVCGLGNGSCGPGVLEKYRIAAHPLVRRLTLRAT
jgi:beta-galactosidase